MSESKAPYTIAADARKQNNQSKRKPMINEDKLKEIGKCPKCGSDDGYYVYQIQKIGVFFDFAGNVDTSDAICLKELKKIRCASCHAHIANGASDQTCRNM